MASVQNAIRKKGIDRKSSEVCIFATSTNRQTFFHGRSQLRRTSVRRRRSAGRKWRPPPRGVALGRRSRRPFRRVLVRQPGGGRRRETGLRRVACVTGFRRLGSEQVLLVASGFGPDNQFPCRGLHGPGLLRRVRDQRAKGDSVGLPARANRQATKRWRSQALPVRVAFSSSDHVHPSRSNPGT